MTTIIRGPRPPEVEAWLERRRRAGQDRFDEVWEGRYVVASDPHGNHSRTQMGLAALLLAAGRRLGLNPLNTFNLGGPDDATFDKLDFYRDRGVQELLVLDWTTRSLRVIDLQRGHAERPDSTVLGMTASEIVVAIDWPPLHD